MCTACAGDRQASERLFALLYSDLKRLAHSHLHRMGGVDELNTTALVHEGVLRLHGVNTVKSRDGNLVVMTRHGEVVVAALPGVPVAPYKANTSILRPSD